MTSLISYACIIHEHISYKLNFDMQKFEHGEVEANYAHTFCTSQSLIYYQYAHA